MFQHEDSTERGRAFERVGMSPICDNIGQSRKPIPKLNTWG